MFVIFFLALVENEIISPSQTTHEQGRQHAFPPVTLTLTNDLGIRT